MAVAPAVQRPILVLGIFSAIVVVIFPWLPVDAHRILHDDPADFTIWLLR